MIYERKGCSRDRRGTRGLIANYERKGCSRDCRGTRGLIANYERKGCSRDRRGTRGLIAEDEIHLHCVLTSEAPLESTHTTANTPAPGSAHTTGIRVKYAAESYTFASFLAFA